MAVGQHDNEPFCRAPNQRCVNMSDCYSSKSCQHEPDDYDFKPIQESFDPPRQKTQQEIVDDLYRGGALHGLDFEMVKGLLKGTPSEGMDPTPQTAEECKRLYLNRKI